MEVKESYLENYKILLKEIKENLINRRYIYVLEVLILRCQYYPKGSTDLIQFLSKFSHPFFGGGQKKSQSPDTYGIASDPY